MSDLYFELTPQLCEACRKCIRVLPKRCAKPKESADISKSKQSIAVISLTGIKTLLQLLRIHGKDDNKFWVQQLLRGSRIHIDEPEKKPWDPALDARLNSIKKQLEEHEYRKMTLNIAASSSLLAEVQSDNKSAAESLFPAVPGVRVGQSAGLASVRQDMKAVNQQISVIINILFSVLGVGFAVAYASYTLTDEIGWRVLLGLLAALAIVLAETWLFAFSGTRGQKKRIQSSTSSLKPNAGGISAREALAKKQL
ncbi:hypothetical protein EV175_004841 [Coemansia sp. RSA 1933]|nr:hypothetical protein EV175_004841 [Coemansia sp. RSA 1933]